jgi:hypothetical protein
MARPLGTGGPGVRPFVTVLRTDQHAVVGLRGPAEGHITGTRRSQNPRVADRHRGWSTSTASPSFRQQGTADTTVVGMTTILGSRAAPRSNG